MRTGGKSVQNTLTALVYAFDTASQKQQEADRITSSLFLLCLPGLQLVSGVGTICLDQLEARQYDFEHTASGMDDAEEDFVHQPSNDSLLPALTYVAGDHPLMTSLLAAPDDCFWIPGRPVTSGCRICCAI